MINPHLTPGWTKENDFSYKCTCHKRDCTCWQQHKDKLKEKDETERVI